MSSQLDHPVNRVTDSRLTDPHLWIEVAEYLFAAIAAVALVWLIVDVIASPLWGGLTSIRLR